VKCKICELEETHPEAYEELNKAIRKKLKMLPVTRDINERFGLNITPNNVSRHKSHLKAVKRKPSTKSKTRKKAVKKKEQPAEMEVYSKEGELLYTNIQEIIDDLEDKEKLFCEAYVNTHGCNATSAYLEIYQSDTYGSAATGASRLVRKVNVQLYLSHLMDERSKHMGISSSFVLSGLMTNFSRCMQAEPVMGRDGEPIGIYPYNANAANKALEMLGKHINMWDKGNGSNDQKQFYNDLSQRIAENQISPVMALLELGKEKLPFQDLVKVLLNKADLSQITEGPQREGDDLKKASTEELEGRLKLIESKKQKLCS